MIIFFWRKEVKQKMNYFYLILLSLVEFSESIGDE